MKQSEAVAILKRMMIAIQKTRSNATEEMGWNPDSDDAVGSVYSNLMPYIFDKEKCVLPILSHQLDLIGRGEKQLAPSEFYNMMYIASKTPVLSAVSILTGGSAFPVPDVKWLMGWEAE